MKEMVGGCCVCSDERGWPDNPLVYCDGNGCTVAVHQACYGIVTVPVGPWFCRKCESPDNKVKVRCQLCPSKSGALKQTDAGGWAHVVCALYIPEVRFGNVTSMEPIVLRLIPPERYNKTCYVCQDLRRVHRASSGACMQCNKSGCKQQFHVTCAQSLGLLCEEAGNYLDNVKYCGYCQHHYSKLKKGGNVKTIPPYKPVSHDSQSSDSGGEEEASAMASGNGTPTHSSKSKGPGRKSSHSGSGNSGKNTPNALKQPSSSTTVDLTDGPTVSKRHKIGDKNKKKPSPSRRGSSTGEGSGSKSSTPAPSPQHTTDTAQGQSSKGAGGSTPGSSKAPPPSPNPKQVETVGVISSLASVVATTTATVTTSAATATTSVVQVPKPLYQESVITNTEAMETKQTKKRKALSAANTPTTTPIDYTPKPPTPGPSEGNTQGGNSSNMWEGIHTTAEPQVDAGDKIKKAKTEINQESQPMTSHFSSVSPAPPPPPPPPAHSPRHLQPTPVAGPSGIYTMSSIRSPSHHLQGVKSEREAPTSLLVSVPLPSSRHGLNLSAHAQAPMPTDMGAPQHIFHQPQKQIPRCTPPYVKQRTGDLMRQVAMDPSIPGRSHHTVPGRSNWGGLNVNFDIPQDINKPGVSGISNKDSAISTMPAAIRNKKRAAMTTSTVVGNAPPPSPIQTAPSQSLASVRRHPQPTPPPIYQETIKDSPPSSPSSERPLKPKIETKTSCTAPHMLGNELNPESGAAARLQEQLTAELAAHAAGGGSLDPLIPPPLINKAAPGSSSARSGSTGAQSLDQLLERQWEQGSQFLMEQAQHFDTHHGIASLLSCLHQLRTENVRLEEHVGSLLQRRDHLLAVNARLAIPLNTVAGGPPEAGRCPRENGAPVPGPVPIPMPLPAPAPVRGPPARPAETITSERAHQLMMREVQQKPS